VGGDDETARALRDDWRRARGLTGRERALCAWAEKLTRTPAGMSAADLAPLRATGLSDPDIHDAAQVVAYFNYINRIADALGTDLEDWMPPRPEGWCERTA